MSKEFKLSFFTSLLVVLLVISNLIGLKLTNFLDLTISVDFLTYPFTFLCTLLIMNMGGKKAAYRGILIAAIIQIFITISYTLAVKLGTQTVIPDSAMYVNELFKVNELNILASLLAFLVSHYVLIYIYDNFKKYGRELYGVVIGLLGALFLNATIYLIITLSSYEVIFIINMLLSNIIVSIIMIILITILFYLLKEKEQKTVAISNMDIAVTKSLNEDKTIEEVINSKKEEKAEKETKKVVKKKPTSKNKNSNYSKKNQKSGTKKTTKPRQKSQTTVKKTDK